MCDELNILLDILGDKSTIVKRHFYVNEKILKENPSMCTYDNPSFDCRQDIAIREVPKLAKEAVIKAIKEWGQPRSKITHVIFATTSGDMPGVDFQLAKLLGLRPNVKRVMLYQQGCASGATVMRIAKDIAENNKDGRLLVICCEVLALTFRAPSEDHLDVLVGGVLFGDGAGAMIIGSNPIVNVENPIFELHWSGEYTILEGGEEIRGLLREAGLLIHISKRVSDLIAKNIENIIAEPLNYTGISNYNDFFWAVHPDGPKILNQIESRLKLKETKLVASREVFANYGNMVGATLLFILDEMRRRSENMKCSTTGEGNEWGLVLGFGPGITMEGLLLKSVIL